MHGFQTKKFNCGKLVEQGVATRYTGNIAEYLAGLSDSESVSRAWEDLRDVIVNAADTILGRIERVKRNNWFDEKCEQVTNLKIRAYKRMQQKNCTRGAVEEYREARREEKRMHKKKKRDYDKQELIELESLRSSNAIRAYYQNLNESRKDFQPQKTLCRDNEGMILCVCW
jgi:hypothetical protein